jgi:hypothetical protein
MRKAMGMAGMWNRISRKARERMEKQPKVAGEG